MTRRKDIRIEKVVWRAVLQSAVLPILKRVELEFSCKLKTIAMLDVNGLLGPRTDLITAQSDGSSISIRGELRLKFRQTFDDGIKRFQFESIYEDSGLDGFSGFSGEGTITCADEDVDVQLTSWTVRRNVWDWMGWI